MHADHLASILLVYILHIYSALMNTASFTRHIHIALRMFALALVSVALSSSANQQILDDFVPSITLAVR